MRIIDPCTYSFWLIKELTKPVIIDRGNIINFCLDGEEIRTQSTYHWKDNKGHSGCTMPGPRSSLEDYKERIMTVGY
ncbi:MAG: hypothetical protein QMD85_01460 [Candidatus Aenigmarchaeota archaeon]|nr:hypothetical protein [Candidatus Aenigmarchaeota archaeon]MDI6722206.1 hypothetical protein [Candidatus Aenigmarchaeota archaeon]